MIYRKRNFEAGEILVYKQWRKGQIPSKYFRCVSVDYGWGVVGYYKGDYKDTIGLAYVRKANFYEKIIYYTINHLDELKKINMNRYV